MPITMKTISTSQEQIPATSIWETNTPITCLSRLRVENMINDYTLLLDKLDEWVR